LAYMLLFFAPLKGNLWAHAPSDSTAILFLGKPFTCSEDNFKDQTGSHSKEKKAIHFS